MLTRLSAFVAAFVLTVSGTGIGTSAPAGAVAAGRYVALGDSYAAGLGLTPSDSSTNGPACGRSTSNYPHQVAKTLDLTLVDVTCSGAVIADLAGSQRAGGTAVPPQFDALTADTRLVSLTIGGNDLGFSAIASYCASLSGADGPVRGGDGQAADCESHYVTGGSDTLAAKLTNTVGPALTAALATIRQKAPTAEIVVVDYPAIVPDEADTPNGGCWTSPLETADSLPFTTADLPYLQQVQARLDQLVADTGTAAGAGVASVYPASLAHTACGTTPWVNGVRVAGFSVAPSSLHPNAAGVTAMTQAAIPVARTLLAGGTATPPAAIRTTDDHDGSGVPGWVWAVVGVGALLLALVGTGAYRVARRRR